MGLWLWDCQAAHSKKKGAFLHMLFYTPSPSNLHLHWNILQALGMQEDNEGWWSIGKGWWFSCSHISRSLLPKWNLHGNFAILDPPQMWLSSQRCVQSLSIFKQDLEDKRNMQRSSSSAAKLQLSRIDWMKLKWNQQNNGFRGMRLHGWKVQVCQILLWGFGGGELWARERQMKAMVDS